MTKGTEKQGTIAQIRSSGGHFSQDMDNGKQ